MPHPRTPRHLRTSLRQLERERRWLQRAVVALVVMDVALWAAWAGGPSFLSW